jgi:NADH-quinone oxidoreductase subunit E
MSEPVLELLLWILLAFFVGCILGCILKMIFGHRPSVATSAGATMPASASSPSAAPAPSPKPKANKKPAARPALANAAKPAAKVESKSTAIAPAAKGEQPKGIPTPRAGQPDKLQRISGIGPKIERTLHALGIFHFDQIAHWTEDQTLWVEDHLKFKGRIARENWIDQSRLLADGNEAEFARLYGTEAAGAGKTSPPPKRRATKAPKPTSAP